MSADLSSRSLTEDARLATSSNPPATASSLRGFVVQSFLQSKNAIGEESAMPWYSAHAIMAVRFKKGRQRRIPIWENILLVRAKDADEAWDKASRRAREDEGDQGGTMHWSGRAATFVFIG